MTFPSPLLFAIGLVFAARMGLAEPAVSERVPAGTTAVCDDGSYSSSRDKRGACRGHRSVKAWFGATAATADSSTSTGGSQPNDGPAPDASGAARPAGSNSDRVWVDEITKVYHCPGDQHHGKTGKGHYPSESDARRKGYHANQSKGCSETDR